MIIGVCGNGYCGSSAVTDYLRENPIVAVPDYDIEFMFLTDVDGLDDLRHHIVERPVRLHSSDAAVKRYREYIKRINSPNIGIRKMSGMQLNERTEAYLNSICQLQWNGWWHYDIHHSSPWQRTLSFRIRPRINLIRKKLGMKPIKLMPEAQMQYAVASEDFDEKTKNYVRELVSLFNPEGKQQVVLDQPYPIGKAEYYKQYFSEPVKTINVLRDPRDIFIAAKCVNGDVSSWIPTENVDDFVKYYRFLQDCPIQNSEDEIYVYFEDLIYHYEETTRRINDFLGIEGNADRSSFNPERSINNTQLFKKYTQFQKEIAVIERELPEFLFDYSGIHYTPSWNGSF